MRRSAIVVGALVLGVAGVWAATLPTIGFKTPVEIPGTSHSIIPAIFDATGDGIPDVVLSPYYANDVLVHPGRGDGTFGEVVAIPTTHKYTSCFTRGRLNGDGVDDMVLNSLNSGGVEVLLSDGAGGYSSTYYPWPGPVVIGTECTALADWDDDGDLDIVSSGTTTVNGLRLNDGTGHFSEAVVAPMAPAAASASASVIAADFDDDGRDDVAFVENARLRVYWNLGGGTFSAGTTVTTSRPDFFMRGATIAADVDGDGLPDLVSVASPAGLVVFRHTAARTFDGGTAFGGATSPIWQIGAADMNGDGRPEIVTPQALFVNQGDGAFAAGRPLVTVNGSAVGVGDLDGNGAADIVSAINGTVSVAANVLLVGTPGSQPSVERLSPASLFHGASGEVLIVGAGFAPSVAVDFGPGISFTKLKFESPTLIRAQIAIASDAAIGAREVRLENTDGAVATGTFSVSGGGIASVVSLTPDRAHAGETVDIAVNGTEFLDDLVASLGAGVTVNSATVVASDVLQINATISTGAAVGTRDLSIHNGSGLDSTRQGAFTVLPVRSLNVTTTRGRAHTSRRAGKGSISVQGSLGFNSFSPDAAFDPVTESAEILLGDPASPVVVTIAPDLGWRLAGARADWRSPKGAAGPRVRVTLDFALGTFRIDVTRADVSIPVSGNMEVDLTLGGEPGTSVRRWTAARGGLVLK